MVSLNTLTPPHSKEAEHSLIAAILADPEIISDVLESISDSKYFYITSYKLIFQSILTLYKANINLDLVPLIDDLKKNNNLEKIGGMEFFTELLDNVTSISNFQYYIDIIKEKFKLRSLINQSNIIIKESYEQQKDFSEIIFETEKTLFNLVEDDKSAGFRHIDKILDKVVSDLENLYRNKELIPGLPTDYIELDRLTSGFQNSDFIIIAGRPSMGKTSFALNVAYNMAVNHKIPIAFFSLEMSAEQLAIRLLSLASNVSGNKLKTGYFKDEEWELIMHAVTLLSEAPIYIDNTYNLDPMLINSKLRRLKSDCGLKIAFIDYLQLLRTKSKRSENRQQEITEISRNLKATALDLNIPIVALSQLSRAIEQRTDKTPQLSDLRESGAIEQDADIVMFVHREERYQRDNEEIKGQAEILIQKHRNGALGNVKLYFMEENMRFVNLSGREE